MQAGKNNQAKRKGNAGQKNQQQNSQSNQQQPNNRGSNNGQAAANSKKPAADTNKSKPVATTNNKETKVETQMFEEDDAIISTSNVVVPPTRLPKERALQKTSWVTGPAVGLDSLDDFGSKMSQPFDQFAGKKTSYSDNIYSTKLDMSTVSREKQQHAKQVEQEIYGTASTNRHVAEERNQIAQTGIEMIEEGEEEAKYGATDLRGKVRVGNQDGGVFNRNINNNANSSNNATNTGKKNKKKITAPAGKFKTFHPESETKAGGDTGLKEMNKQFMEAFSQKQPTDSFFQPKAAEKPVANLQQTQATSSSKPTSTSTQQPFNLTNVQSFTPSNVAAPAPGIMTTQATPFSATSAPSFTPSAMPATNPNAKPFTPSFHQQTSATATQVVTSNPFAAVVSSVKEFKPTAKPFQPSTGVPPASMPMPVGSSTFTPPATGQTTMPQQQMMQQSQPFQPSNIGGATTNNFGSSRPFVPSNNAYSQSSAFVPQQKNQYVQQAASQPVNNGYNNKNNKFAQNNNSFNTVQTSKPYMPSAENINYSEKNNNQQTQIFHEGIYTPKMGLNQNYVNNGGQGSFIPNQAAQDALQPNMKRNVQHQGGNNSYNGGYNNYNNQKSQRNYQNKMNNYNVYNSSQGFQPSYGQGQAAQNFQPTSMPMPMPQQHTQYQMPMTGQQYQMPTQVNMNGANVVMPMPQASPAQAAQQQPAAAAENPFKSLLIQQQQNQVQKSFTPSNQK